MTEDERIDFDLLLENQSRIYDRICKVADDIEYLMQKECRAITARAIERWSLDLERKSISPDARSVSGHTDHNE